MALVKMKGAGWREFRGPGRGDEEAKEAISV
jgi:hypothetical protein